jgi:hypothetical protein
VTSRSSPDISSHIDPELAQRLAERRLLVDQLGVLGCAAGLPGADAGPDSSLPAAATGVALTALSGEAQTVPPADLRDGAPALTVERACSDMHEQATAAALAAAALPGDARTVGCSKDELASGAGPPVMAAEAHADAGLWAAAIGEARAVADGGASSRSVQSDAELDPPIELLNQALSRPCA